MREKDQYDRGATEHLFKAGDRVRVRLMAHKKGQSKLESKLSGPHKVVSTRGVLITVRKLTSGRVYAVHYDRLKNLLFDSATPEHARATESSANPTEDKPDLRAEREEPPARVTRSGRERKPYQERDLKYGFISVQ